MSSQIKYQLAHLGLEIHGKLYRNLPVQRLMEESILKGEGKIGHKGALMVDTGKYTGRSPKDKYFVVESSSKDNLWWGEVNQRIDAKIFDELFIQLEIITIQKIQKRIFLMGLVEQIKLIDYLFVLLQKKHGRHILQIICL